MTFLSQKQGNGMEEVEGERQAVRSEVGCKQGGEAVGVAQGREQEYPVSLNRRSQAGL